MFGEVRSKRTQCFNLPRGFCLGKHWLAYSCLQHDAGEEAWLHRQKEMQDKSSLRAHQENSTFKDKIAPVAEASILSLGPSDIKCTHFSTMAPTDVLREMAHRGIELI